MLFPLIQRTINIHPSVKPFTGQFDVLNVLREINWTLPSVMVVCRQAGCYDVSQTQELPIMSNVEPAVPKRRSRTQEILRSEYELSKYEKPIMKDYSLRELTV